MKVKKQYQIFLPLLISSVLAIGMVIGYGLKSIPVKTDNQWVRYDKNRTSISDVIGLIDKHYYEEKESYSLVDKAIHEIVEDLDPYSAYIPPYHTSALQRSNKGKYFGLGIETTEIDGEVFITKILNNSPANDSEILKGSKILGINGISLIDKNWTSDSLSQFLGRNQSANISFEMDHVSYDSPKKIGIEQGEVTIPNITDVYRLKNGTGYIKVAKFGDGVYRDFMESIELLLTNDTLPNLIIDLKSNPGGFLQEVSKIISQFLPERIDFLKTIDNNGDSRTYSSNGQSFFEVGNIIVLIDQNSASASEIFAGVLQDMDRAIIIGEHSFGKGLVQEQFNLSNGGVLRLSVSQYQLPSGRYIGRENDQTLEEEYTSLMLGRKLLSNGKINPDIEIAHENELSNRDAFALAVNKINRNTYKTSSYLAFLESYKNQEVEGKNSTIDINVMFEIAAILFGDKTVRKDKIKEDIGVLKALEVLENKDEWGILN